MAPVWQYQGRVQPVLVPSESLETFAAAWGAPALLPSARARSVRPGEWCESLPPAIDGWMVWIDWTTTAVPSRSTPLRPQPATVEPVLPPAVEWGWQTPVELLGPRRAARADSSGWQVADPGAADSVPYGWQAELPGPARSGWRTPRAEPAMVLYEPVAAVLPPFTWYVGMHHVPVRRPRDSTAPAAMELINFGSLGVSPGTELYWQPVSILFGSIV